MNIKERVDLAIQRIDAMSDEEFRAKFERPSAGVSYVSIQIAIPEPMHISLSHGEVCGFGSLTKNFLDAGNIDFKLEDQIEVVGAV